MKPPQPQHHRGLFGSIIDNFLSGFDDDSDEDDDVPQPSTSALRLQETAELD